MRPEDIPRDRLTAFVEKFAVLRRREERALQQEPGGLLRFIRFFWPIVEPARPLVEGWPLEAICEHLEAVTAGEIKRLLINICPGFMKSLAVNVFFPAWEWGPMGVPSLRYIAASYSQGLTVRDNVRFRNIIMSPEYREMWGNVYGPSHEQFNLIKVANDHTGWKLATSVGGIGTGERSDRFIIDDGNSVKEAESELVRASTNQWIREVVPTRLNDAEHGVIINVQQRTHADDISGVLLESKVPYTHLCIPMEYNSAMPRIPTRGVGWTDPRSEDGELAWPERFPRHVVDELKAFMGPYATSGQFQQSPVPRGGGIIKRDWWRLYTPPDQVLDNQGNVLKFGSYPPFDFVIASADTAYTEKEENDPTGFTIWGVWMDHGETMSPLMLSDGQNFPVLPGGQPKVMLINAWRKRLEIHGEDVPKLPNEADSAYFQRASPKWGLVEWIAHSCKKFNADMLIIEGKASGLSVAQEMRRLYANSRWSVQVDSPEGDKTARLYSVQPLFSGGLVYAPDRDWAETCIDEVTSYPRHKFKDLTDSTSMALRFLRKGTMLMRKDEWDAEQAERMRYKPKSKPLYPMA